MHKIAWMDSVGLRPINTNPFYDWTEAVLDNLDVAEYRADRAYRDLAELVDRVGAQEYLAGEIPPEKKPRGEGPRHYSLFYLCWQKRTRRAWRLADELREELREKLADAAELGLGFIARLLRDPQRRAILLRGDI